MKTIYQTAISDELHWASNWKGIFNSYRREIVPQIEMELGTRDVKKVRRHPVSTIFLHKILDLKTRHNQEFIDRFFPYEYWSDCYQICKEKAK